MNIGLSPMPKNINVRPWYARRSNMYQVQLGTEDPALDYNNDMNAIEDYNNFLAPAVTVYPLCVKEPCKTCKNECKNEKGLKWLKGGKQCFQNCKQREKNAQMDRIRNYDDKGGSDIPTNNNPEGQRGLSTGAKVAIGVGALALVGLTIYLIARKK